MGHETRRQPVPLPLPLIVTHTSTTTLDTLVRNLGAGIQGWFQNCQAPRIDRHKQPLIHGSSDDEAMCFPWFESSRKARRQQHKMGRAIVVRIQEFVRLRLGRPTDGVEGGLWAGPRRASLHVEPIFPIFPGVDEVAMSREIHRIVSCLGLGQMTAIAAPLEKRTSTPKRTKHLKPSRPTNQAVPPPLERDGAFIARV